MTPDELWEKHKQQSPEGEFIDKSDFLAALAEYGQAVKGACSDACSDEKVDAKATGEEGDIAYNQACDDCAAAISREPMP